MKTSPHPHADLISHVQIEFAEILSHSPQGISLYLDDPHWTCNDKLATMLGYASADELLKVTAKSSFLDALVAKDSLERVPETYLKAVNDKVASVIPVTWKKKGGGTLKTEVIFVPFSLQGNTMVLHFITPV